MGVASSRPDHLLTLLAAKTSKLYLLDISPFLVAERPKLAMLLRSSASVCRRYRSWQCYFDLLLQCAGDIEAGNATSIFCFSVPAISKLAMLLRSSASVCRRYRSWQCYFDLLLQCAGDIEAGNATSIFCFSVPAISKLAMLLRSSASVCRRYRSWQCYFDLLLQCAGDIEADYTDSGIDMDCADQNHETPHLGDWWGELTTTTFIL